VKADGYGVGATKATESLIGAGCRRFFVATIDEAISLRDSVTGNFGVYVLEGLISKHILPEFDAYDLVPVLNTPENVRTWSEHAKSKGGRRAVLALDTGMNRLGLTPRETTMLANEPDELDGIEIDYIMSHLACADEPNHPLNEQQRTLFNDLRAILPATKASFANSGGIFLGPQYHYDLVRPGAALYGLARSCGAPEKLQQVVGLKAQILQIRIVDTESTVGYAASRTVPAKTRLATVAAGYADGYQRSLSNSGHGYAAGVKVPVAGRVSMDLTVFDISEVPENSIRPGDDIELICEGQTVDDVADAAGTIGYEILTSVGTRYAKHYVGRAA
jgi:alanine racemase